MASFAGKKVLFIAASKLSSSALGCLATSHVPLAREQSAGRVLPSACNQYCNNKCCKYRDFTAALNALTSPQQ
jgi:hypothetical protein